MYFQVCSDSTYPQHSGELYRTNGPLVFQVHPDQNPDASSHDKFVEINTAYMVLGKAASRRVYDMQMRYSSHPFFNDSYEGPRPYGPYEGPYRSRENNVHDIPYWKKDPFSDYGYEYEQMRR